MSVLLLPTQLQNSLQEIVHRSNPSGAGIRAILLSTTEGVPLGRVEHDAPLNEEIVASMESVWAPVPKQLSLLGMGKVKQALAIYDHGTLVHLYQGPLVRFASMPCWDCYTIIDDSCLSELGFVFCWF